MARRPKIQTKVLKRLYKKGYSCTEIAEQTGLSPSGISLRLRKAGVKMRSKSSHNRIGPRRAYPKRASVVTQKLRLVTIVIPPKKLHLYKMFKAA